LKRIASCRRLSAQPVEGGLGTAARVRRRGLNIGILRDTTAIPAPTA
jgi:hypothetical protein